MFGSVSAAAAAAVSAGGVAAGAARRPCIDAQRVARRLFLGAGGNGDEP